MSHLSRLACLSLAVIGLAGCSPTVGNASSSSPFCLVPPPARTLAATTLRQTGRIFDLAIKGEGYFQMRDPESGKVRYTRAGQFRQTAEGNLVTPDGRLVVEPQITIPTDALEVQISPDGFVKVRQPLISGQPDRGLQPIGQFQLARFSKPEMLEVIRPGVLAESCTSGTPVVGPPGLGGLGSLMVGTLEEETPPTGSKAP